MQTIEFTQDKETKRTKRFAEVVAEDSTAKVGSIYLANEVVAELGDPEKITVTIAAA